MAFWNKLSRKKTPEEMYQSGDYVGALKGYKNEMLRSKSQNDSALMLRIADLYLKTGNRAQAKFYYIAVGESFARSGFFNKSVAAFKKALNIDPDNQSILEKLAAYNDKVPKFMIDERYLKQLGISIEDEQLHDPIMAKGETEDRARGEAENAAPAQPQKREGLSAEDEAATDALVNAALSSSTDSFDDIVNNEGDIDPVAAMFDFSSDDEFEAGSNVEGVGPGPTPKGGDELSAVEANAFDDGENAFAVGEDEDFTGFDIAGLDEDEDEDEGLVVNEPSGAVQSPDFYRTYEEHEIAESLDNLNLFAIGRAVEAEGLGLGTDDEAEPQPEVADQAEDGEDEDGAGVKVRVSEDHKMVFSTRTEAGSKSKNVGTTLDFTTLDDALDNLFSTEGPKLSREVRREEMQRHWPLFRTMPREPFMEFVMALKTRDYEPDEFIVHQGAVGEEMYLIADGEVEVTLMFDGKSRTLARLKGGDFFGEASLLTGNPRNATVRAVKPTSCLLLGRPQLDRLSESHPSILATIESIYYTRSRHNASDDE